MAATSGADGFTPDQLRNIETAQRYARRLVSQEIWDTGPVQGWKPEYTGDPQDHLSRIFAKSSAARAADPLAAPQGMRASRPGYGELKPDNTVITVSADTTCDIAPVGARIRCGKPGTERWFFGCPHEHIGYADVCTGHLFLRGNPWTCDRCRKLTGKTVYAKVMKTEKI